MRQPCCRFPKAQARLAHSKGEGIWSTAAALPLSQGASTACALQGEGNMECGSHAAAFPRRKHGLRTPKVRGYGVRQPRCRFPKAQAWLAHTPKVCRSLTPSAGNSPSPKKKSMPGPPPDRGSNQRQEILHDPKFRHRICLSIKNDVLTVRMNVEVRDTWAILPYFLC